MQTIDYTYNIRGWLKQINDPANLGIDLFAFKLGYNEGTTPLYNGNIALSQWKTANTDNSLKTYNYTYDALNTTADTANDYTYDANGNLKSDANKSITAIQYNYLNLPTQVTINGQNIVYVYDALGTKLKKTVNTTTTDYAGNFIYENNALQFFNQPEGYVEISSPPSGELERAYVYQFKDHLGNIRLSYKDISTTSTPSLQIVEENNYYPFGLKHKGYNANINGVEHKYKYNNKELQEELGLNWYDYGARNYDASLGRWMNLDPLAEMSRRYSPYTYAVNNPIYFIDPDGMYATDPGDYYTKDGRHLGNDGIDDKKVYVADSKNEDGTFNNATDLGVTHDDFATSSNVVKYESSGNKEESLWIAHAANNAKDNNAIDYKEKNSTLNDQLTDQNYSTTPEKARTPLADTDSSSSANNARAAVIDVLSGGTDPTGGAVLWDGSDFLSNGTSHNKFKEFKSVDIDASSLSTYSSAQRGTPNSIFSSAIKGNTSFSSSGKSGRTYSLHSTGAKGKSIFWKIKK